MEEQDQDRLKNQEDVIPGSQLDKLVNETEKSKPLTDRTGANHAVPTSGTVVIKKDEEEEGQ